MTSVPNCVLGGMMVMLFAQGCVCVWRAEGPYMQIVVSDITRIPHQCVVRACVCLCLCLCLYLCVGGWVCCRLSCLASDSSTQIQHRRARATSLQLEWPSASAGVLLLLHLHQPLLLRLLLHHHLITNASSPTIPSTLVHALKQAKLDMQVQEVI